MTETTDRVAVVGGGFSGAMLAARLAERGVPSLLIDAQGDFGRGVAYSTPFDGHLLNVRSGRMSAVADRANDFVDWLARTHPDLADPDGFAPRRLYGDYVRDRLDAVQAAHPDRIARRIGTVAAVTPTGVVLSDGTELPARAVVLATGNPPPRTARGTGRVIGDPWAKGALDRIGPDDAVLIVGTGLTMVDMLLMLKAQGWRGRAVAVSRRGLLPRAHADRPDVARPPDEGVTAGVPSARLRHARRQAGRDGWREVMEGLRPITARLWTDADTATRARWVRHLRPWWDVHRHRIAPEIDAGVQDMVRTGRLTVHAGRMRGVVETDGAVELAWSPRGREGPGETLTADWLLDCTGPGHDAARDPLTAPLIHQGRARLDPLGLGLDLDEAGRVLDNQGRADPRLFVLGPPARGAFWETIAVPDIRSRIEDVTDALINAV